MEVPSAAATTGVVTKLGSVPTDTLWVDALMSYGPVTAQVEGFYQATRDKPNTPRVQRIGGSAMLGLFVVPKTIQLGARADVIKIRSRKRSGQPPAGRRDRVVRAPPAPELQALCAYQNASDTNPVLPKGITNDLTVGTQLLF